MARAAYVRGNFSGGEWSKAAQGRVLDPAYVTALNVCRNAIPIEAGAWQRRGGTRHCCQTRGGLAAKLIGFDFQQPFPYQMLVSDGFLRFLSETDLVGTNDDATISAISGADPAVITTGTHGWSTGDQALAISNVTQLMNRQLTITVASPTSFSIADAITGDPIDGADLDTFTAGTIRRIAEVATPYTGDLWQAVRSIQAETTAVLVNGYNAPQALTIEQEPTDAAFAEFAIADASFLDGPYLDPVAGSWATASALSGVVTITLSFQPYDPARAYSVGEYSTYLGQGYRSIQNSNQNKQPDVWPSFWLPVNAGDPLNDGAGFTTADVGRLIRLFSQPSLWDVGATYSAGQIVTYEAAGDAVGYYEATAEISAGTLPGRSTSWAVRTGAQIARWTWGRITGISASGVTTPNTYIGDLTGGGNIASAFDGNASKSFASAATASQSTATRPAWYAFPWPIGIELQYGGRFYRLDLLFFGGFAINFAIPPAGYPFWTDIGAASNLSLDQYVGGHLPAPTQIASATVTPTTDVGFTNSGAFTLILRAKATVPSSASDGTALGTTGTIANTTSPVSIVSSDQSTAWNYVWVEILSNYNQPLPDDGSHSFTGKLGIAQVQIYSPNIANGSAITVQIVGDPLLYANACRKWRLGLFGGENGYPTCGTYDDNRIWFGGVLGNRVDSSMSGAMRNGLLTLNMAPTMPDGTVTDAHAISAVFTATDLNKVFWMDPDDQGIICGTQAGEWLVGPAAPGALSPLNAKASRRTKVGCADVLPRRTDHGLLFVQKFRQKIQEYFADVMSGKFASPHITEKSKHLTVSGVQEIAYQQELAPAVWARLGSGALMGITYKRDSNTVSRPPDMAGAHRHDLGSGRAVRSISGGASAGGNLDSLYMVTEEAAGGAFHVEMMQPLLSEGFSLSDCWFVDDALIPASFEIDTTSTDDAPSGGVWLYGLWPLEGKTVTPWLCGLDCGSRGLSEEDDGVNRFQIEDYEVEGGKIFVPFGDGVSQGPGDGLFTKALVQPFLDVSPLPMAVGFSFVSDGQIVRPVQPGEIGSRLGPGIGNEMRDHKMTALLYGCVTGAISFGTDFDHALPAKLTDTDRNTDLARNVLFSGIYKDTLDADADMDAMVCWRVSRPHPAFMLAVGPKLSGEDE